MATTTGKTPAAELLEQLCRDGRSASFFQALMLLERIFPDAPPIGHEGPASNERIRVRPSFELSCPTSDVESIELKGQRVQLTATFLGLYGVDSPLPSSYSEHIGQIAEDPGGARVRGFLDLFHHRLYSLLYRTWRKSRPVSDPDRIDPLHDRVLSPIGYSAALGLGGGARPRLAEARVQVLRARTLVGLEALLLHRLGYACPVQQLEPRRVGIPVDQRSRLGRVNAELGSSLVAGAQIVDRGKICVEVLAGSFSMYERLLPEGHDRRKLDSTVAGYLRDPLDYDVEIKLPAEEVPPWRLGQRGTMARSLWLGTPRPHAVTRWRGTRSEVSPATP